MDSQWVILGLAAAFFFGLSGLMAKVALGERYYNLDVRTVALMTIVGISLTLLSFYFLLGGSDVLSTPGHALVAGVSVGVFWALGQMLMYYALVKGAEISRLAPLYNINTLVVLVLAVIFLKELPDKTSLVRVAFGAVLIVLGGILVSI